MPTPLPCNHCGEVCGRIIEYANNDSPPEVEPWDDDLVDSEGYCYCSLECMNKETLKELPEDEDEEEDDEDDSLHTI